MLSILKGTFTVNGVSGMQNKPITLKGTRKAILNGSTIVHGYGLYLNNTSWWVLDGFQVQNSLKGIMIDFSTNILINNVSVRNIGEEGVHFRKNSSFNTIQYSTISYTGMGSGISSGKKRV